MELTEKEKNILLELIRVAQIPGAMIEDVVALKAKIRDEKTVE